MLSDIGILPQSGNCLHPSYEVAGIWAAIRCPPNKFKLTLAEVANSCALANLTCPYNSAVCICQPCKPVPPTATTVQASATTPAGVDVGGASSNSSLEACSRLAVCKRVLQARADFD